MSLAWLLLLDFQTHVLSLLGTQHYIKAFALRSKQPPEEHCPASQGVISKLAEAGASLRDPIPPQSEVSIFWTAWFV